MSEKLQGFVCSCPRIRFFRLPYSAYSRSFSSDSLEYSLRSLARPGSLSPTPAVFSACGRLLVAVLKLRDFLLQIGIVGNAVLIEKYHC